MFEFRNNTIDSYIFYKVVHQNEYKLPDDLTGKIIIDIGAHIGSFTVACLQRNAEAIYAYEAHPENYKIAVKNIKGQASVENLAVWNKNTKLGYNDLSFNTGQHKVGGSNDNKTIDAVSFDDIINKITTKHNKRIDILKIDCEGAEYQILYPSCALYSVDNIAGEYHNNVEETDLGVSFSCNGDSFVDFLRMSGFLVYSKYIKDAGIFFASRKINETPFQLDKRLFV